MVTYPSTPRPFEETICELCEKIHAAGGRVYMDGANMNAKVSALQPGKHWRGRLPSQSAQDLLHPHGGGGPGVGPICVAAPLTPFLPGHSGYSILAARPSVRFPRPHGAARAFS